MPGYCWTRVARSRESRRIGPKRDKPKLNTPSVVEVSAVIACYRCKNTIGRAVDSIACQTQVPAETILVDDCSGDDTLERLHELAAADATGRIRVIALSANLGPGGARNCGWEAASQPYIAFLDADDAWHPKKIEIQLAFMRAHPEVVLSGHDHRREPNGTGVQPEVAGRAYQKIGKARILLANPFITPSVMLRTGLPYRFEERKRYMEDMLLWQKVVLSGANVCKIRAPLAYIFKAIYGVSGQSARLWEMEKGELAMYRQLHKEKFIPLPALYALWLFSLAKFARRLLVTGLKNRLNTRFLYGAAGPDQTQGSGRPSLK